MLEALSDELLGPLGGLLCYHTKSLEECVRRFLTWKEATEDKGLRVNAGKIKVMICGTDLQQSSDKLPCAICHTCVGSNSCPLKCDIWRHMQWVHKKCSGFKSLTKDPDYRCTQCQRTLMCDRKFSFLSNIMPRNLALSTTDS